MSIFHRSLCWYCEKNCPKKEKRKRPGKYVTVAGNYRHYIVEKCNNFKDLRGDGKK